MAAVRHAVKGGRNLAYGKWEALLACGHKVVCDAELSPPSKCDELLCPECLRKAMEQKKR